MKASKLPPSASAVRCEADLANDSDGRSRGYTQGRYFEPDGLRCICQARYVVEGRLFCRVHAQAYALELLAGTAI
jgi:hypothetical protein